MTLVQILVLAVSIPAIIFILYKMLTLDKWLFGDKK